MSGSIFSRFAKLGVVALASLALTACGINSVPTAEEAAKARWADVQAAFQERANLVPNLAEVAKSAAEQERAILTDVIEARAKATSIQLSADDLNDPAKMQQFQQAQDQFSSALSRLLVTVERYPELKAVKGFQDFQTQYEGMENRIGVERRKFNDVAREYNNRIKRFPGNLIAGMFGFTEKGYFEAQEGTENAPDISFK